MGLAGGLNTYGYVGEDPLEYMDPQGLNWALDGGGLVVGAGAAIWASEAALTPVLINPVAVGAGLVVVGGALMFYGGYLFVHDASNLIHRAATVCTSNNLP